LTASLAGPLMRRSETALSTESSDRKGTLATALARASQFLASDPKKAIEQAREILRVVP